MQIKTNNQSRHILYWHELSDKERKEFDYLANDDRCNARFVRYKQWVYDIGEFMRTPDDPAFNGWHGYSSDSAFSGVVLKFTGSYSVVMGSFYS